MSQTKCFQAFLVSYLLMTKLSKKLQFFLFILKIFAGGFPKAFSAMEIILSVNFPERFYFRKILAAALGEGIVVFDRGEFVGQDGRGRLEIFGEKVREKAFDLGVLRFEGKRSFGF